MSVAVEEPAQAAHLLHDSSVPVSDVDAGLATPVDALNDKEVATSDVEPHAETQVADATAVGDKVEKDVAPDASSPEENDAIETSGTEAVASATEVRRTPFVPPSI